MCSHELICNGHDLLNSWEFLILGLIDFLLHPLNSHSKTIAQHKFLVLFETLIASTLSWPNYQQTCRLYSYQSHHLRPTATLQPILHLHIAATATMQFATTLAIICTILGANASPVTLDNRAKNGAATGLEIAGVATTLGGAPLVGIPLFLAGEAVGKKGKAAGGAGATAAGAKAAKGAKAATA